MRIKLINPPEIKAGYDNIPEINLPYGLGVIASYLEENRVYVQLEDINALVNSPRSDIAASRILKEVFRRWRFNETTVYEKGILDEKNHIIADCLVKLLDLTGYDMVGIGITTRNQLCPALLIAEKIKHEYRIPVVIGGAYITLFVSGIFNKHIFIDYAIEGEGEIPIVRLVNAMEGEMQMQDVPSLWYRRGKEIIKNNRIFFDIENQSCPDYRHLNLKLYGTRVGDKWVMPYGTSRGCLNKCRFCMHNKLEGKWQTKSINKIINDLCYLKKEYGVNRFFFIDSAINLSYRHIDTLCDRFSETRICIEWVAYVYGNNLDDKLLGKMNNAGCRSLLWGIESASKSVLRRMGKDLDIEHNTRMLQLSNSIGIKNRIFIVINYPYETVYDLQKTLLFIKENFNRGNSFLIRQLVIYKDSDIYNNASMLGIRLQETTSPEIYSYKEIAPDPSKKSKKRLLCYRNKILRYDSRHNFLLNLLKNIKVINSLYLVLSSQLCNIMMIKIWQQLNSCVSKWEARRLRQSQ